ncbi:MAG: pyruvate ferredoxin oxidoreductase beta subunit [Clostridia bacterium]|nr:pyruvate ferredoxin oxidoreductase beta subunit [Clostridia bacterium]
MALNLKELSQREPLFTGGARLCVGCPAPMIVKQVLYAAPHNPIVVNPTCCLEVSSAVFPYSSWKVPYYHNAFENAAAVASGIERAVVALKKRGRLARDKEFDIIVIGGDGGTYDIGLQALSGMLERGHRCLYVCYDNGAYMNTGIQRSGATPYGAWTTTSHVGPAQKGKQQPRKDIVQIAAAHGAYAANASLHAWRDLMRKVQTALNYDGPSFINVQAPCPRGWRFPSSKTVEIARLGTECCFYPLYEVTDGGKKWIINHTPRRKLPVEDYLRPQGRFAHFFQKGNEYLIEEFQRQVDERWEHLLKLAEMS